MRRQALADIRRDAGVVASWVLHALQDINRAFGVHHADAVVQTDGPRTPRRFGPKS